MNIVGAFKNIFRAMNAPRYFVSPSLTHEHIY